MLGPKHSECIMKLGIQKLNKLNRAIQLPDYHNSSYAQAQYLQNQ